MKLKFSFALATLFAFPLSSHAVLRMTFKVGAASTTVADGSARDADGTVNGQIVANTSIDLNDGVIRYSFASYFAAITYAPLGGLDGAKYSIQSSVPSIQNLALVGDAFDEDFQNPTTWTEAADDNLVHNAQVSVYVNYDGFTSISGEPMRAQANTTLQMTLASLGNANNTSDIDYGAYYKPTVTNNANSGGIEVFGGSESLYGHPTTSNTAAEFQGFDSIGEPFTSNAFSMGVFYGVTPTSTTGATRNSFNFSGTSFLEQVPEPSHTALPVGIASGLLVLRRRRVMR